MDDDLENRTLNAQLIRDGYIPRTAIPDEILPENLAKILIELARGKYTDIQIVPGEVALRGCEWRLDKPSHIVYVKDNIEHPDYEPGSVRVVQPGFKHRETGEYNSILPLGGIND